MAFSCSVVSAAVNDTSRDHLMVAGDIDHHEVVARNRAQADGVGRIGVRGPVPRASPRMMQQLEIGQKLAQLADIVRPNFSPSRMGSSNAAHFR